MFQKKSMPSGSTHIDTLIGSHASFNGNLNFEGSVRIDGQFEGNIKSSKEGTLIVSETALVKGEINVPNLLLHGTVRGNVRASKSIQIGPKGRLDGDLEYTMLTLSEGASVNGRCNRIETKETTGKQPVKQPVQQANHETEKSTQQPA
ncbi:MAG TPA: polymer-forming cytoskeletal protein [Mariprofundaceae bacterium]|nr:polymer-forming cytoskeletal protein [Mariprofundaceae bacterium]